MGTWVGLGTFEPPRFVFPEERNPGIDAEIPIQRRSFPKNVVDRGYQCM